MATHPTTEPRRWRWWQYALITVPLIVVAGNLSGLLSNSGFGNPWFDAVEKPGFMPPGWVFGVVWTTLYTLMGIAVAIVLAAPDSRVRRIGLTIFFVQLALNYAWSPIFFGAGAIDWGLVVIIAMVVAAGLAFSLFWRVKRVAGLLLLPYLAWLCLATALNFEIGRLNPGADRAPLGITGG
ncbi:TspO/MBR family protein [Sphingomonas sp. LHG3406-1]|uniref:TspO/MBR family protein n=1 Tax=Sphingomonas sp. LHG3406-1 TaxID=2804617 RepID=UPI00260DE8D9|nr:TspO/MBR family protein [Sphingomonas sp. LHG3406-1]